MNFYRDLLALITHIDQEIGEVGSAGCCYPLTLTFKPMSFQGSLGTCEKKVVDQRAGRSISWSSQQFVEVPGSDGRGYIVVPSSVLELKENLSWRSSRIQILFKKEHGHGRQREKG